MIQEIRIKNLALVDNASIEFNKGLNILSGETGTGKSILILSIYLILGIKADKSLIRDGCDSAYVEVKFVNIPDSTKEILKKLSLDYNVDELILSRKITNNKSVSKIDGEIVTLTNLKDIASSLVTFHGQNKQIELKNQNNHLNIIDSMGDKKHKSNLLLLKDAYESYKRALDEYEHNNVNSEDRDREISLLTYEIDEIKSMSLKEGEDKELEEKYNKMLHIEKIKNSLINIKSCLNSNNGIENLINVSLKEINKIYSFDEKNIKSLYDDLLTIEELTSNNLTYIEDYLNNLDFLNEDFNRIETRLNEINKLKIKYNKDIKDILSLLDKKQEKLDNLKNFDTYISKLKDIFDQKEKIYLDIAEKVSKERKSIAVEFTSDITKKLKNLSFSNVMFEVRIKKHDFYSSLGIDSVSFLISTNFGIGLKPLSEISSGGELSRIMLCIETIYSKINNIKTIVFDEIDAGISGNTAKKVAEAMGDISKNCQIICVTHLPQILSMGDVNYKIDKKIIDNKTQTIVTKLDEDGVINELSRMISGNNITEENKISAVQLRKSAKHYKNKVKYNG